MEGSLDGLLRYLLEEIALCGDQGALPIYVLTCLNQYFQHNIHDGELTPTIDRPFQDQVWRWLARHPDIKIGRNGEANHIGLADVVAHNDRVDKLTQQSDASRIVVGTPLRANDGLVDSEANVTAAGDGQIIPDKAKSLPLQVVSVAGPLETPSHLRMFASLNCMWLAVAGHGVDNEKIATLEFTCLSVIASRRESGILQPELVRITGQDKRSVPWRTQKLCDRGYIIKKEVVASGSRTSLCILKRFTVSYDSKDAMTKGDYPISRAQSVDTSEDKGYVDARSRVLENRLQATFDILKSLKIILWDDLKMKLGIWRNRPESRRLAVAIRKLELLKCVRRVKAPNDNNAALYRCVKYLREPTKVEYDMLCDTKHKITEYMPEKENDDNQVDLENYSIDSPAQVAVGSDDIVQLKNDVPPAKVLLWTPDRLMVNILRNIIVLSGSKGMSANDMRNTVIGAFFERPLDNLLTRLVEVWQLSQPLHLRYLAILRDVTLSGKIQHYVYYEYDAFKSLVDAGKASWEAVETVKVNDPENRGYNAAPDAIPDVDEYGFPKLDEAKLQGRDNNATMAGSLAAAKIAKFRVAASEASTLPRQDGHHTIARGSIRAYKMSKSKKLNISEGDNVGVAHPYSTGRKSQTEEKKATKVRKQQEDPEKASKPRGRPRQHPKAGLPENASSLTLEQLYKIKTSQKRAIEYERTKITNLIASRVEQGEDEADSTECVLAEVAARNNANPDPAVSEALERVSITAKKRKSPTIERSSHTPMTNFPSMAAHSFIIPNPSDVCHSTSSSPALTGLKLIALQKKISFLLTEDNEDIPTINPSESATITTLDGLISSISKRPSPKKSISPRKKLYRSRKFDSAIGYFPSTLAHTNSNLAIICRPARKSKKATSGSLNDESHLATLSPNNDFAGLDTTRVSTSRVHELNSGNGSEPTEMSTDSSQSLHPIGTQYVAPGALSGVLQHTIQQTQALSSSTPHKRRLDDEPYLTSYSASKRPRLSPSSRQGMASAVDTSNNVSMIGYLPSVAAHTQVWFGVPEVKSFTCVVAATKEIPRPRKKTAKALDVEVTYKTFEIRIPAQTPQRMRPNLTYEQQLESIARNETGVHLGKPAFLKRIHGRGRLPKCRLIVFKSPGLNAFSWFTPESTPMEATNAGWLSSIRHDTLENLGYKTLSSAPKSPLNTSKPDFRLSQARDEFLSGVRNTIRFSKQAELSKPAEVDKTTELSYSAPFPAIDDDSLSSIASTQTRKRKRVSISTDAHQPLQKMRNIDLMGRENSQPTDWSLEYVPTSPKSITFDECIPSSVELTTLVPSKKQNIARSTHETHVLAHGSDSPNPNIVYTSTSYKSNITSLSVVNASDGLGLSANPIIIGHALNDVTVASDTISSPHEDIGAIEAQNDNATGELILSSVTPDFETSSGAWDISSLVGPEAISSQEEQREALNVTKDSLPPPPMDTSLDHPQNQEFVLEPSIQSLTYSKAAPTIVRVNTTGGSVAVLRRKIIIEIIDQCGGVFPGDREIWQPFCDVWKTRIGGGKPDHRTVLAAVKYLVDSGKLRKLKFTFSHQGVATTGSIITRPDIPPTDPKVKDLRQKMIHHVHTSSRPKPYVPKEAEIFTPPVEIVNKPINRPRAPDVLNRSWTHRPEVVEEKVKLQYPARLKRSSNGLLISQGMEKRRKAQEERQMGSFAGGEENINSTDVEMEKYRHGRRLNLSGADRRRKIDSTTGELRAPTTREAARTSKPTIAEVIAGSSSSKTNTNSRRLTKLHVNSRPPPRNFNQSIDGNARQSDRNPNVLAKPSISNEYQQLYFMEVMDEHSNFDMELSPEPADINHKQNWWLLADQGHLGLDPPGEGDQLDFQPEHKRPKFSKSRVKKIHKLFLEQLQEIGLQYRIAARRRRTKFRTAKNCRQRPSDVADQDIQVSTLMDPEHLFHVSTGTFSTSFAGILEVAEVPDLQEHPSTDGLDDLIEIAEEDLPLDLQDVLAKTYDTKLVAHMERLVQVGFNPNHDPFIELVDRVRKWELDTPYLANTTSKVWNFINFQLPGPQETVSRITEKSVFIAPGLGGGMKRIRHKNGMAAPPRPVVPAKRAAPMTKQPARRANLARLSTTRTLAVDEPVDADGRAYKKVMLRGPRLQSVSSEVDDRILVAVLLVRTLVGGSEQHIDWVLLARMFGSKFSERLLHRRWVAIRVRYKRNLEKLQSDIQQMFLHAYENSVIPPLDFDNYDNYDWDSLVEWTMKNLETPVNNLNKDLPSTRTELDTVFELRKPPQATSDLALFYELESVCSVPRRHVVIQRKPHVIPLHTPSTGTKDSTLHDIAKTWVRANVLTSEKDYDANLARDKLISLGEPNVEAAVKDLLSARVILQANRGRLIPGRNYDVTDYCLIRLRKKIEANIFQEAAVYKTFLDLEFEKKDSLAFSYHTRDAEVMALLNLAAQGRITIIPKNPPMQVYGLVDNGYRTRHMDKARLNFDIEIRPTASYIAGNPLVPLPPPPGSAFCTFSSPSTDPAPSHQLLMEASEPTMERFPFWIGIDNRLVPAAWALALAAVLSLAVVQPGVSPSELAKTLRPALEAWEVVLVFQWCVDAGVATWADERAGRTPNGGVKVAEWWWLAFGRGEEGGKGDEVGEGEESDGGGVREMGRPRGDLRYDLTASRQ